MTERIELQAEKRAEVGTKSVQSLRDSGYIPAVIYGKEFEPFSLKVEYKDFQEAYEKAGSSTMIDLKVGKETLPVIIQEVSEAPVSGDYLHADFYKVRLDQKITAQIPLEFIGESPAIKDLGGILNRTITEVEVYALPQDLPPHIDVDISSLEAMGDSLTVKDLKVASGVELQAEEDEIVATIVEPEEEIEEEVESTVEDVEVISKEQEEEGPSEEAPTEEKKEE
jgi:large subunit ribosomal protein L25